MTMTKNRILSSSMTLAILLGGALVAMQRNSTRWPQIRATEGHQTFVDPGKGETDTPFHLLISDANGNTAYRLECHNGYYDGQFGISFSGDFHCGLFAMAGDERRSWNLLADATKAEGSSDWANRGRMLATQLRGECADTPYGTRRVFRLRGMRIVFVFSDLKWISSDPEPALQQFTFTTTVRPDPSAQTATSAPLSPRDTRQDLCL
jgi:hypothetical protein